MSTPKSFQDKFPTPSAMVFGGMRDRLFHSNQWLDSILKKLFNLTSGLPFQEANNRVNLIKYEFIRRVVHYFSKTQDMPPLNSSKLPLIKWERGLFFNGGAHAVSKDLPMYSKSAALLHFRFTRGIQGLKYTAIRGQHAANGSYIKKILNSVTFRSDTPISNYSRKFVNSASLRDLLE